MTASQLTNVHKSYILGLVSVSLWSTVATAFKLALASLDLFQVLFISCLTSTLCLGLMLLLQGKLSLTISSINKLVIPSLTRGFLNPFIYYLVLFEAYNRLPAQIAQPINYSWVIVLSLMSVVFLKQRLSRTDWLAGMVCYAGVIIISSRGDWITLRFFTDPGVWFAIFSTVIWSTYWILTIKDTRDITVAMFLNFLVSLPLVTLSCFIFSDFYLYEQQGVLASVYIGLFEMSITFVCWSLALKLAENTSRVGNLVFLSPFLSLLLIHHILGEQIYTTTWAGLMIIVSGLLMQKMKG